MKLCIQSLLARRIKLLRRLPARSPLGLSVCQTRPNVELWPAFSPQETMAYAIIKTGGRQFRVAEGDTIDVDLLDVEPGKTATFGDVLLFADGKDVTSRQPARYLEQR